MDLIINCPGARIGTVRWSGGWDEGVGAGAAIPATRKKEVKLIRSGPSGSGRTVASVLRLPTLASLDATFAQPI